MKQATFRFTDEFNELLAPHRRGQAIPCTFRGRQSVKHLIEALGVPHTQVGAIRANDRWVDFHYLVQEGDRIEVSPASAVEPGLWEAEAGPLDTEPCFLLDNHLGKLATYLRMLGFDAQYRNDYQDEELAQLAGQEERILLTRDRGLLMHKVIRRGYWVRALEPRGQALEVARRFNLLRWVRPFRRCLRCNGRLQAVDKAAILHRLLPLTKKYYDEFAICPDCDQVYWKGSHYEHMLGFLQELENS